MNRLLFTLILVLIAFVPFGLFAQNDAAGSQDHPLITRYPGAQIDWYETQAYEKYQLPMAPVTGYRHIEDWQEVAGKITRIFYVIPGDRSASEVYYNYEKALKDGGFRLLQQGLHKAANVSKEVGGRGWMGTAYVRNPLPVNGKITLFHGTSTAGGSGYLSGELRRPSGNVYVAVSVYQHREDEVVVLVDVIETEAMENDLVSVDPEAMSGSIDRDGKVVIYGLYFDFDKAVLKPESQPVLEAIAQLLRQRPALAIVCRRPYGHERKPELQPYAIRIPGPGGSGCTGAGLWDFPGPTRRQRGGAAGTGCHQSAGRWTLVEPEGGVGREIRRGS